MTDLMKIAIMGYGTVGSGVFHLMRKNAAAIEDRLGWGLSVKYVLDLRDFKGDEAESLIVHDFETIANDKEVKIVVETMGGLHPAYDFTKRLLEAGKSVCTSNKELVAEHGIELMALARQNNVNYMFEASCGGGIPIIRPFDMCLTGDVIEVVSGILNGTTNYILTKMEEENADFIDALKNAQELGYAEKDPTADVEGYDTCRKIAILSSMAYRNAVYYKDVYTEGISKITAADIQYAKKLDMRVKLLGKSRRFENGFSAMVAPFLVSKDNPLYNIQGVMNAVFVHGNMVGDTMFCGSGAGSYPTASAVAGDVVDCARHKNVTITRGWKPEKIDLIPTDAAESIFFVRVAGDASANGGHATEVFGAKEFVTLDEVKGEFAFFTERMTEKEFENATQKFGGVIGRIRVCD